MQQKIQDFLSFMSVSKGATNNTLMSYKRDIECMAGYFEKQGIIDVKKITATNVNSYILYLEKQGKSVSSISRNISSMKTFYRYLHNNGDISSEPTLNIVTPRAERKKINIASMSTMEKLLNAPDVKDKKGIRDKAMLYLLYSTGIRVSELLSLRLNDVNLKMKYIVLNGGKVNRVIPIETQTKKLIKKYIDEVRMGFDNEVEQMLFLNCNGKAMTRQGFWKILKTYAKEVGIEEEISPQTLRHSYGVNMIKNGVDLHKVQKMMGHVDISSTQLYLQGIVEGLGTNDIED